MCELIYVCCTVFVKNLFSQSEIFDKQCCFSSHPYPVFFSRAKYKTQLVHKIKRYNWNFLSVIEDILNLYVPGLFIYCCRCSDQGVFSNVLLETRIRSVPSRQCSAIRIFTHITVICLVFNPLQSAPPEPASGIYRKILSLYFLKW